MLTAEVIREAESILEFLGSYQEAGAISLPFHRFHGVVQVPDVWLFSKLKFAARPLVQQDGTSSFFA